MLYQTMSVSLPRGHQRKPSRRAAASSQGRRANALTCRDLVHPHADDRRPRGRSI